MVSRWTRAWRSRSVRWRPIRSDVRGSLVETAPVDGRERKAGSAATHPRSHFVVATVMDGAHARGKELGKLGGHARRLGRVGAQEKKSPVHPRKSVRNVAGGLRGRKYASMQQCPPESPRRRAPLPGRSVPRTKRHGAGRGCAARAPRSRRCNTRHSPTPRTQERGPPPAPVRRPPAAAIGGVPACAAQARRRHSRCTWGYTRRGYVQALPTPLSAIDGAPAP
jgi:hypothetical protein